MGIKSIVIIPAYNEEKSIVKTVQDICEHAPEFDYVIINDCSTAQTLSVCRKHHLHVLNLPVNLGIGGAVQTGFLYAHQNGYDYAVQFDGDFTEMVLTPPSGPILMVPDSTSTLNSTSGET